MTVIERAMHEVDLAIVAYCKAEVSKGVAWQAICDAVDRARPSTTEGAVKALEEASGLLDEALHCDDCGDDTAGYVNAAVEIVSTARGQYAETDQPKET